MSPSPPLHNVDLDHVWAHTAELWRSAAGESFFITGGTGFFGVWLLETFAAANDRADLGMKALVLTRNPGRFAVRLPHLACRSDITLIEGDITSFRFPKGCFENIIHAATDMSTRSLTASDDLRSGLQSMISGTRRVLEFASLVGADRLLFTSSGAVYGPQDPNLLRIPEDDLGAPDPMNSRSTYGIGKRFSEHLCLLHFLATGCEVKVARCFAFIGPHLPLDTNYAIGNFIRDGLKGGPICINGDDRAVRSYLYAADLSIWLWTVLFRGAAGRAYNVGSAMPVHIAALAHEVALACGVPGPKLPTGSTAGEPSRYVPSIQRAEVELGLLERIPRAVAIDRTIAWHTSKYL
jgi:dTDP-glucose 4,6-dehydratase